jgi:cytochrome P450
MAVLNSFMLAMTCYPDVQAKAQEELDRVLGKGRLPDFADEESLPYMAAILRETIRWSVATPLGMYFIVP